jgi:hypothetical protein
MVIADTNIIINNTNISRRRLFRRYYIYLIYLFLIKNSFFNLNSLIQTITSYNIILFASSIISRIFFKILLIYLLVS